MPSFMVAVILGIALFAATNIDDIFILVGFFAEPRARVSAIIIGQYLGIGALVLASIIAALIALVVPAAYVGLLGLAPIVIGTKKLVELWRSKEQLEEELVECNTWGSGKNQVFAVAIVTISNGGDNIAVYTPVFSVHTGIETMMMVAVFGLMTALWCAVAHWLVHHRTIGAPILQYGHRVLPLVLIGLGIVVMFEAGTFMLLIDGVSTYVGG